MNDPIRKYWDYYRMKPNAPFIQREFGFYSLDRWHKEGLPIDANLAEFFGYDGEYRCELRGLGWCEAGFAPCFEECVLEDRGAYELVQDFAGRSVLCFKGRRNGFMPEYVAHPVTDLKSWEENCHWRMDPKSPKRQREMDQYLPDAAKKQAQGEFVAQCLVGGYMYLRSLIGPEQLLYTFYDDPALIHACMQGWFDLADDIIARHQALVHLDEIYIGEDICYNHGSLISPEMMRTFLFPYYQQLLQNAKRRQPGFAMGFHVDTDGYCDPVIDLYRELGMNAMDPFEAASGCDVLRTAEAYPDLRITGGLDKRILAGSREGIDRMLDRILPAMQKRGGYIPNCDHGVPEEVSLENYLYYRKRMLEFA